MKKLFIAGIAVIGIASFSRAAITSYVQLNPPNGKQSGGFNVGNSTVTRLCFDDLTCQSTAGGGGGGGSGGNLTNLAAQYSPSFYSASGSSNTLSGLAPGTSGQFLTTGGAGVLPFWTSNTFLMTSSAAATYLKITDGATTYAPISGSNNYIRNTSSLQSGATFYVSSATVSNLNVGPTITFGQGSAPGLNEYDTVYTDNGSELGRAGMTNSSIGWFWRESPGSETLMSLSPVTNGVGSHKGELSVQYDIKIGSITGAGLTTCGDSTHAIAWNSTTNRFSCQTISSGGLPLPGGATNYINATSSLQAGATFYVSSGTVGGNFVATGTITTPQYNVSNAIGDIQTINGGIGVFSTQDIYVNPGSGNSFVVNNGSTLSFVASNGRVSFTAPASIVGASTVYVLPAQDGSSGQFLKTDGSHNLSFATASGSGSGGYAVQPATVAFNLAQGVTGTTFTFTGPSQSTVTYGLTVGSFTVSGTGPGASQFTEGTDASAFASAVGKDNFWASSSSHAFVTNYNGSASTGTVVVSTSVPTTGHLAIWSGQGTLTDGGTGGGGGTPSAPTNSIQFNSASSFGGSANFSEWTSSITNTFVGGEAVTYGVQMGTATVFSTTASTNAFVVKSTAGVAVVTVSNNVTTLNPGDKMLTISSAALNGSATDYSLDTYGNEVILGSATFGNGIVGTIAGGNASVGIVGEYISSAAPVAVAFPGTGNYGDLVSLVISSGDWDVTGVLVGQANSATVTTMIVGISSTTGNSSAGLIEGDSMVKALGPTAATDTFGNVPSVRVSQSTTKTWYLKYQAGFSVATPNAVGRLSARRVR